MEWTQDIGTLRYKTVVKINQPNETAKLLLRVRLRKIADNLDFLRERSDTVAVYPMT